MRGRCKDQETSESLPKEESDWQSFSYCHMFTVPKLGYRDAQAKMTVDRADSKALDSQKTVRARLSKRIAGLVASESHGFPEKAAIWISSIQLLHS